MEPDSISLTAFNTRYSHFEFVVLPSGLTNDPAVFMDLMDKEFASKFDVLVKAYQNDILFNSQTFEEYPQLLEILLKNWE